MFDVVPLLSQDQSYRNSIEMIQLSLEDKEVPKTDAVFIFGESNGEHCKRLGLDTDQILLN